MVLDSIVLIVALHQIVVVPSKFPGARLHESIVYNGDSLTTSKNILSSSSMQCVTKPLPYYGIRGGM